MKKVFDLFGVIALVVLVAGPLSAQDAPLEKRIKLVKGHTLVLKGEVYEGDDRLYTFKAKSGQTLVVRLRSRDADFTLNTMDGEVYPITKVTKYWSGKLPYDNTDQYSITLTSNYKSASYQLEILLK